MKRALLQTTKSLSKLHSSKPDIAKLQIRGLTTREANEKRCQLFVMEKKRQLEDVGRIEKIEIKYMGVPQDVTLIMNKDISTPYDCAKHLGELHMKRSVVALLDGAVFWDMHKPLQQSCSMELQHFLISDPQQVNRIFWRSCSFVLGACAMAAFKDKVNVKLHSFPGPDVRSGSFVYDVDLQGVDNWEPTVRELYTLSTEYIKLTRANLPLDRLDVSVDLALEMFRDNEYKSEQIPDIAQKNEGNITLYKMGDHIDISKGPMLTNSGLIGRSTITAVHQLHAPDGKKPELLYRFQGVAIPLGIKINHFAYRNILENRAKNMNPARTPYDPYEAMEFTRNKEITA